MPNCIEVYKVFVLQYIIEPNKFVYFLGDDKDKLSCTENKLFAYHFVNRERALRQQHIIKNKYCLEFQIIEV